MAEKQPVHDKEAAITNTTDELSDVVAAITLVERVVIKLNELTIFQGDMHLREWALLHALDNGEAHRAGQIASQLGISPQRIALIIPALRDAEYISALPAEDDNRKIDLKLLPGGRAVLHIADGIILGIFREAFKGKPNIVLGIRRNFRALLKVLTAESAKENDSAPL